MDVALSYRAMAFNNAWANHRLLKACVQLSQEAFEAPRTGFFGSLQATFNHILQIDCFYLHAIESGPLTAATWSGAAECTTVQQLQTQQLVADQRLISVTETLSPLDLERIIVIHRNSRTQRERLDRLLLHMFQHQIHHRGQAHAMLSATDIPPPQLDEFFSVAEAPLRAEEFQELGWSEDLIWGDGGR